MGKREIHICDVCKADLPFGEMGFPKFRAAEVRIQLYKSGWGDTEWLAGWKGELCSECVAIINRTAETFHREMSQRQKLSAPGERLSSDEAAPPAACKQCGGTGVIETGNNDMPCDCPAGDEAVFNTGQGRKTGAELKRRR